MDWKWLFIGIGFWIGIALILHLVIWISLSPGTYIDYEVLKSMKGINF